MISLDGRLTWDSCHTSYETHHERDKAITELCFEIIDQFKVQSPNEAPRSRKKRRHTVSGSASTTDDGYSVTDGMAPEVPDTEQHVLDDDFEATSAEKRTKRQKKEHKRMMKELERKAGGLRLDTSAKTGRARIATQSDIDEVAVTLHGPEFVTRMCGKSGAAHTTSKDRTLQENVQAGNRGPPSRPANSHVFLWSEFDHDPDPAKAQRLTQRILENLGLGSDVVESCKAIKPSLERLQRLVEEDLISLQNELRDVRRRERIYWGFVGKDVWKAHWERMKERDWHTGVRIAS